MKLLSIDLELNNDPWRIIQVGICVGDTDTGEISHQQGFFVKIPEPISPFIQTLTGITDADLLNAGTLEEAYLQIIEIMKTHQCFWNPLQWGQGDIECVKRELTENKVDLNNWPFGRRHIDAKTIYQAYRTANGLSIQSGLSKSMNRLGLSFLGSKHNAIDDSINTFRIYHKLLQLMKSPVSPST